jgi:signal peptidase I
MHLPGKAQKLQKTVKKTHSNREIPISSVFPGYSGKKEEVSFLEDKESWRTIRTFLLRLIVFALIVWVIFTFLFGIARVNGESMYPRIRDGDLIFYSRTEKNYSIGDVLTFRTDGYRRVARVVAKGGDVVDINEEGQLLVNGNVQEEEIFYPTEKLESDVTYPYTVAEDSYFVLCDFRTASIDSRGYGAISASDIDGVVISILLRRRGI